MKKLKEVKKAQPKKRVWIEKNSDLIDAIIDNPGFIEFLKKAIRIYKRHTQLIAQKKKEGVKHHGSKKTR